MKYKGALIADIHFGALPIDELYDELQIFLNYIDEKPIDFIIILGDWFDRKLNMNSRDAKFSTIAFERICQIAMNNNIKVRMIQGTESHDNNQLEILEILAKNKQIDFKVFYEVGEEELFPNFNVLYIPEEYITSFDEKYGEYVNKTYDMIFGHGVIQEVKFAAYLQQTEKTMKKAPIFKSNMLTNMCLGPIFFGHVHTRDVFHDRVYYVGSYSRWVFGEEDDKGFYVVKYDADNKEYDTKFIINDKAKKYDTLEIYDKDTGFYKLDKEYIHIGTDLSLYSVQINKIISGDTWNKSFGNLKSIMCKLEIERPKIYERNEVYYELVSSSYQEFNCINAFEWRISTKPDGDGDILYK